MIALIHHYLNGLSSILIQPELILCVIDHQLNLFLFVYER